ncbi:4-oxalomesaconate tautomerase [Pusillimonas sp. TS35]|uniref:4-oxalomesaconate tautomerase n=1 Tax=Paracandidimonas lactea TaxID=2895524 RepID=UPI00136A3336|nr:4-oxalomesaconate tautomerase [Paracandidimonas lactea]MYN13556.1 4-oxalomesaconate tautomerase [Pusillimonas sp. TS35]
MELEIPCVMMRGGTSRGPYFRAEDLPADPAQRDRILLQVMGSPHVLQVNGLGGGNSLTSKVAIVSRSQRPGCDVDYLFAQVAIEQETVDTRPNCGNLLSGVGPYAIEEGLVPACDGITSVRIFNVNTNTLVEAAVPTPHGRVNYEGDTRIDGVPGTGAAIVLNFLDVQGGITGALFPTGARIDVIDGVAVTCIDAAMPVAIVDAASFGLRGNEAPEALDADRPLLARLEALRREAGLRMGLGDVSESVVPKLIIASPAGPRAVQSRYLTPHRCHKAHAVTGAIAVASSFAIPGTVTHRMCDIHDDDRRVAVLHPAGCLEIALDICIKDDNVRIARAGVIRTARKIMKGTVFVSDDHAAACSKHVEPAAA